MLAVRHLSCNPVGEPPLHDVSLQVQAGEIVVLHGPNGAGKSTLCRCLAGLQQYESGAILLDGEPLPKAPWALATSGLVVLQKGRRVFPTLTVKENLLLPVRAWANGYPRQRFKDILSLFPRLAERLSQLAGTLSGGEQQMVAIGRAILSNPRVLVIDEPFLGLAPRIIDDIIDVLSQMPSAGVPVLVAQEDASQLTHITDRSYSILRGEIASDKPLLARSEALSSDINQRSRNSLQFLESTHVG